MICARCANAADQQLEEEQHCDARRGPGAQCFCQHRTDRYRKRALAVPEQATVVIHVHPDPLHLAAEIRDLRRNGAKRS